MSDDDPARPISGRASPDVRVDVVYPAWWIDLPDARTICREAAAGAVAAAGLAPLAPHLELGVRLTDDAEIGRLNKAHRGREEPTNVLAFPILDCRPGKPPDLPPVGIPLAFGDVVLALDTIRAEAVAQAKPFADHVRHLIVHGVLHLAGYDHECSDDAAVMERVEIATLAQLGVPDPYLPPCCARPQPHEQP